MDRSLPNMSAALPKAPKIYPIHLLMTSNYRLPNDVDRFDFICLSKTLFSFIRALNINYIYLADAIWNDI